jgi:hypothetical protein
MGGDVAELTKSRRRIKSGELAGPRLVFAGPLLEGPASEADKDTWIIRSPDEARHAVDSLVALGVDFIKVHDGLARDTYLAVANAAKAKGISFAGHVPASMTPAEASELGQQSIEHLAFLPKPCGVLFDSKAVTMPSDDGFRVSRRPKRPASTSAPSASRCTSNNDSPRCAACWARPLAGDRDPFILS